MSKIIEGVVIGITVGVILELFRFLRMIYLRKKQIDYLRETIKKAKQDIQNMQGVGSPPPEISISPLELITRGKIIVYQWLISELKTILKDWAEGLSYKQRYDLSSFVTNHERMRQDLFQGRAPSLDFYEKTVFSNLRTIKWLKLP